jgi:hypothetical protein
MQEISARRYTLFLQFRFGSVSGDFSLNPD